MRGNSGVKFFLVVLAIGILTYLTIYGANILGWRLPSAYDIRQGIDLKGGVHATLYPDKSNPTDAELETAKAIIARRLDTKGIFDRTITIDSTNKRIVVEIPWKAGEKDFNPQKAIDELGKTAMLSFQEVDENKKDEKTGAYLPTGKIVIQGMEVVNATPSKNNQTGSIDVSLELDDEGAKKFEEATGRLIGKPIAIYMDDQLISAPVVQAKIGGGHAVITGQRSAEEAGELAATIRSGALPFKLEAKQVDSISPMLGEGALSVSIKAGYMAFALVCLFMLAYYRLPGILANIALLGHTVIQLLFISWFGISLTLPGIAGIILTIGMGVDANVIIFERIKEELKNGKTLRAAIDVGFKRAFAAVLDANMTTLLSAVSLYIFGSGPIKGFAITLGLGVALSFLTAVTASRIMLKAVADTNIDIAKHHWLYGA